MNRPASLSVPAVKPFGDRGLVVEFEDELSPTINRRVRALARRLLDLVGVVETVPTLRSVLVVLDPLAADRTQIIDAATHLVKTLPPVPEGTSHVVEVPVVYGGEAGPDLEEVAGLHSMAASELITLHSAHEYLVFMLGFAPGFPYLGILPEAMRTPRLPSPRLRVLPGSVGIADALTGIYPLQTAGGWRVIGRTPLVIYDPHEANPFLFRPGDRVRFMPVEWAEFHPHRLGSPLAVRHARRPTFEVLEPGLYTTIQDLGRPGYRSLGLPAAGAMDPVSLQIGNLLVGNPPGTAAIECTAPGPALRTLDDATIAVTGADLSATLDGVALEGWTPVAVRPGQTIRFGAPRLGMWAYIAVSGGIDVAPVLGSASTYVPGGLGGAGGRRVLAGDVLGRSEGARRPRRMEHLDAPVLPQHEVVVRAIPGPQEAWFTEAGSAMFVGSEYRTSVHSDRAGIRLEGPAIAHRGRAEILSDGLLPGAIQVPEGGQPIVIMPDGPTTGGYPKIGVVASVDLRLLAQASPFTRVRFVTTTVEAAIEALRQEQAALDALANSE